MYYKVVTQSMESLGLRKNPNIMQFKLNVWVQEPNPRMNNRDGGGIWCCKKLSSARALKKYFEKRYGPARIFECQIARVLYQNSYRTKTDWIRLINEVK